MSSGTSPDWDRCLEGGFELPPPVGLLLPVRIQKSQPESIPEVVGLPEAPGNEPGAVGAPLEHVQRAQQRGRAALSPGPDPIEKGLGGWHGNRRHRRPAEVLEIALQLRAPFPGLQQESVVATVAGRTLQVSLQRAVDAEHLLEPPDIQGDRQPAGDELPLKVGPFGPLVVLGCVITQCHRNGQLRCRLSLPGGGRWVGSHLEAPFHGEHEWNGQPG